MHACAFENLARWTRLVSRCAVGAEESHAIKAMTMSSALQLRILGSCGNGIESLQERDRIFLLYGALLHDHPWR